MTLRIALIYDLPYPFHPGGAERRFWELARRLTLRGHDVSLLTMKMWTGPDTLVVDGVRCIGVSPGIEPFTASGSRSLLQPFVFARHLYRYLRRHRFDLIDCAEMPYLGAIATRWAIRGFETSLVITWHEARGVRGWTKYNGWKGAIAASFEWVVSRLATNNIAISDLTATRCASILRLKDMAIVGCGVDTTRTQPPPARSRRLLHVGRLVRHKQVDWAIHVLHSISEEFPETELNIVGVGYAEPDLRALSHRLGLNDRVRFLGNIDDEALQREYAEARLLLLPSSQEGFGMVIIEAMAAGTPVIALDTLDSAARLVITDGVDGLLVRSPLEMATAAKRLLNDDVLWQLLADGARRSAQRYDWETAVLPALEACYLSARAAAVGKSALFDACRPTGGTADTEATSNSMSDHD